MARSKVVVEGDNNKVYIAKGNTIHNSNIHVIGSNCNVYIDSPRDMRNCKIIVKGRGSCLNIGKNFSIGSGRIVCQGEINIGQNCMVADNVEIWSSDTHEIINVADGTVINPDEPVNIGDHVWLGAHVKILKGADISNDSVVGMGATVAKGVYDKNSILAGVPAKKVRGGITWRI